jgi:hypothetical protein
MNRYSPNNEERVSPLFSVLDREPLPSFVLETKDESEAKSPIICRRQTLVTRNESFFFCNVCLGTRYPSFAAPCSKNKDTLSDLWSDNADDIRHSLKENAKDNDTLCELYEAQSPNNDPFSLRSKDNIQNAEQMNNVSFGITSNVDSRSESIASIIFTK